MDDICKNIEEYNPIKEQKIYIVFDDMIAGTLSYKSLNPIVTELFIRAKRLNISLVFYFNISYFAVPKKIRLTSTNYFIRKIPNKQKLQEITFNHSTDTYRHQTYIFQAKILALSSGEVDKYEYLTGEKILPSD